MKLTNEIKSSFEMCPSCSSCSKWDTCVNADLPSDKLVPNCFVGSKLRLSVELVEYYASCNPRLSHLNDAGFIWLGAKYKSGNLFNLYLLSNFKQDGSMYICDVCRYQANYSGATNKVNIYLKGFDFSMTPSQFKGTFGIDVPKELLSRRVGGLWSFKRTTYSAPVLSPMSTVTKSFGFKEC